MTDTMKSEWRKALWTVVVAGIIAIVSNFIQNISAQSSMNEQLKVMQSEITLIRSKIDIIQIQMGNKVDRETLDNNIVIMNGKLDEMGTRIFEIYKEVKR